MDNAPNLGFLTVVQENAGYLGGYLVTNGWGRPLEFRLSTAVQPNRVQQILYGATLKPYIFADLIGKTLVEKCGTAADLILTDSEPALDLRQAVAIPILWLASANDVAAAALEKAGAGVKRTDANLLVCHPNFSGDVAVIRDLLAKVDAPDLAEPFTRIREALTEARKLGATSRAA